MGQRADEVGGRGHRAEGETEVYVARPGEARVVHADATESMASVPAGPMEPADDAEVEEIRAEMEATRAGMSETIDAIQDRLNPDDLKEQAKDIAKDVTEQVTEHVKQSLHDATTKAKETVRDATVGRAERLFDNASDSAWEVRESVIETVKANPIPAALVGIGLGWLLMNRGEKNRQYRGSAQRDGETYRQYGSSAYGYGTRGTYPSYGARTTYPYTSAPAYSGSYRVEEEQGGLGRMGEKVGETAGRVQERASEVASDVGDRASEFAERTGEMAGDVVDYAGSAASRAGDTAMDVGSSLLGTIRQNPVPATLAALSLGWLWINSNRSSESDYESGGYYAGGYSERESYRYSGYNPQYENGTRQQREGLANRVGETAGQVQDKASELASDARDQVSELGSQAQYFIQRAPGRLEQMVQDNPLAVGAVAAAVGVAIGLMVPETRQEHELMGEARDAFVDRAQGMVQQTGEKVQRVVEEVQSTAQEEAKKQKLTS